MTADTLTKQIADRYIGRDGSVPGTYDKKREFTRAAVFAAQRKLKEVLGVASSPVTDKQMHEVLRAAFTAAPELHPNDERK